MNKVQRELRSMYLRLRYLDEAIRSLERLRDLQKMGSGSGKRGRNANRAGSL